LLNKRKEHCVIPWLDCGASKRFYSCSTEKSFYALLPSMEYILCASLNIRYYYNFFFRFNAVIAKLFFLSHFLIYMKG
jgi:hypothetical protein